MNPQHSGTCLALCRSYCRCSSESRSCKTQDEEERLFTAPGHTSRGQGMQGCPLQQESQWQEVLEVPLVNQEMALPQLKWEWYRQTPSPARGKKPLTFLLTFNYPRHRLRAKVPEWYRRRCFIRKPKKGIWTTTYTIPGRTCEIWSQWKCCYLLIF